jgi:hypothetical protein
MTDAILDETWSWLLDAAPPLEAHVAVADGKGSEILERLAEQNCQNDSNHKPRDPSRVHNAFSIGMTPLRTHFLPWRKIFRGIVDSRWFTSRATSIWIASTRVSMPDDLRSPIKHHLVLHRIHPEQGVRRLYSLMIERDLFGTVRLVQNWGRIGTNG